MYLLSIFFLIDYLSLPGSVSSVIEKESSYHAEPEGLLETICLLHFQWLDLGKLLEKVTLKVTQVLWSGRLGDGAWWRDSQPASVSEHLPLSSSSSVCLHHDRSLLHVCSCVCAAFTLPWNEISPDTGQQAVENQMRHPLGRTEEGDCVVRPRPRLIRGSTGGLGLSQGLSPVEVHPSFILVESQAQVRL